VGGGDALIAEVFGIDFCQGTDKVGFFANRGMVIKLFLIFCNGPFRLAWKSDFLQHWNEFLWKAVLKRFFPVIILNCLKNLRMDNGDQFQHQPKTERP